MALRGLGDSWCFRVLALQGSDFGLAVLAGCVWCALWVLPGSVQLEVDMTAPCLITIQLIALGFMQIASGRRRTQRSYGATIGSIHGIIEILKELLWECMVTWKERVVVAGSCWLLLRTRFLSSQVHVWAECLVFLVVVSVTNSFRRNAWIVVVMLRIDSITQRFKSSLTCSCAEIFPRIKLWPLVVWTLGLGRSQNSNVFLLKWVRRIISAVGCVFAPLQLLYTCRQLISILLQFF